MVPMGTNETHTATPFVRDLFTRESHKPQIEREVVVPDDTIGDSPGFIDDRCFQGGNGLQIFILVAADAEHANPGARLTGSNKALCTLSREARTGHAALADDLLTVIAL